MCSGLKACSVQKNPWVKYVSVAPVPFSGNLRRQQLIPVPLLWNRALQNSQKRFLHLSLPSAFRPLFCHKGNTNFCWGNGERAARFMHRFPFPTSPLQDSLNKFFVNRTPGNGESSSGAACSARLCSFCISALFHSPYSSWWLTCLSAQPQSLEASSSQCHEKEERLLVVQLLLLPQVAISCPWANTRASSPCLRADPSLGLIQGPL